MDYQAYSDKALEELKPIQDSFLDKYKIDTYDNWYYEETTSLLRLYNDEEDEVYFKYIPLGTFSSKTKSWMWTWNKEDSFEKHKKQVQPVRDFGKEHSYEKLINPHFDSDIYDGWDFLAIAYKLLSGVGVYKVDSDHLSIYFLIVEEVSKEEVKELEEELINCDDHGKGRLAFVCQHLWYNLEEGFEEAFESYYGMELAEGDDFQAWCNACEKERLKGNGWTNEAMEFADTKLVCESCYFIIKESALE